MKIVKYLKGPCFPSLGTIWANWAAPHERSRMVSISFSGIKIGLEKKIFNPNFD